MVAGAVVASTPAERGQNLFFDPSRGSGLAAAGGAFQIGHDLRMLFVEGGGLRGFATGTSFNLTGRPSPEWLLASDNDVGLPAFYDAAGGRRRPASCRPQRGTALARALLALGGTLAVLEDAGDPAHVRNDFRAAYLDDGGAERRSIAARASSATSPRPSVRPGVPGAAAPVDRPTVLAYSPPPTRRGWPIARSAASSPTARCPTTSSSIARPPAPR